MRRSAAFLIVAALLLVGPASAAAGTAEVEIVSVDRGKYGGEVFAVVHYRAAPGEGNDVTVVGSWDLARIRDTGAAVTAGRGCVSVSPAEVHCDPAEVISAVDVATGDGDDGVDAPDARSLGLNVTAGPGSDHVSVGGSVRGVLHGGDGDDHLVGGGRDDRLIGGGGADLLDGGEGADRFSGDGPGASPAADVIHGGGGVDSVSYGERSTPVVVDLGDTAPDGAPGEGDRLEAIENVLGGAGPDVIRGDRGPNELRGEDPYRAGGAGDDIEGGAGDDHLEGGEGDDRISGGAGDDVLTGGSGHDRLAAGSGADAVRLGAAYPFPAAPDRVSCGSGRDIAQNPEGDRIESDCETIAVGKVELLGLVRSIGRGRAFVRVRAYRGGRTNLGPARAVAVRLYAPPRRSGGRPGRRLGGGCVRVRPGRVTGLRIRLTRAGRRFVARSGRRPVFVRPFYARHGCRDIEPVHEDAFVTLL